MAKKDRYIDAVEIDTIRSMFDVSKHKNMIDTDVVKDLSKLMLKTFDYVTAYFTDDLSRRLALDHLYTAYSLLINNKTHAHIVNNILQAKELNRTKQQLIDGKG